MNVFINLDCYEINGEKQEGTNKPFMQVTSHWNIKEYVIVKTMEGASYTVLARELKAAIDNATSACKI